MDDCKILIIDDDEDDIEILSEAFMKCGVDNVHYVFSAMQAFIFLQDLTLERLPKLIVTDHFLPGITGIEFLKDLKAMDKYKDIPVIVLASIKTEKEIEIYKKMGAIDYLVKPVSYDEYVKVAVDIAKKAGL